MRFLYAATLVALARLAVPGAADACGEPSTDCGPWYEHPSDSLVSTLSTGTVASLTGTALAVLLLAKWRRLHRAVSILLGLQIVGLLGTAVALAAIRG